ncbi:MAG TPA: tripartite tricarboxylate transporter substrate binding protein [Ramlibacter sp.]|nr:tripartite tricarboxylate transporter substrate binding protein [Ramlibacter sp.]
MARSLSRRGVVAALGVAAIGAPFASLAQAGYPNKPVKVIVSFAPGGTTDILARFLAQKLSDATGQSFVVENKPGAGGTLGNDFVAKSAPDGYTLLMGSASNLAVAVSMYKNLPYDYRKDLIPIAQVAAGPFVIVVNPQVPANNLKELIALAKAKPGQVTFATSGNGTSLHLAGELINAMADIKMNHIPYKGTGPATMDTISGQVNMTLSDMVPFVPHIQAGKLRPLAQTTAQRSRLLPDLPTVSETLPGYDATSWYGMMAPAGTPPAVIQRINQELQKILQQPDVRTRYAGLGVDPVIQSPDQFAKYIESEQAKWADVIRKSGAKVE